jgi:subtilisin family serine protease
MGRGTKCALALAILGLLSLRSLAQEGRPGGLRERPRVQGQVLYQVRTGASAEELAALEAIVGHLQVAHPRDLHGLGVRGHVAGQGALSEEDLAARILQTGAVKFAEPNYLIDPAILPNEWYSGYSWHHATMNSPGAWDVTTGQSSVIVAVCDSGIQSSHPDLQQNLALPGYNSADGSSHSEPVGGLKGGHGTMVAGCIGAVGNNGIGVAGVSWKVKILPIRITNDAVDAKASGATVAGGIRWAADHGARVINVSYDAGSLAVVDAAAQYARSKGALVFISAGNIGVDVSEWPNYSSFLLVGATDWTDARASFSNYGSAVDLVAPGVQIRTTLAGSSYGEVDGTSFSSPLAAGVAALIFGIRPSYTPFDVESILLSTCVDLGAAGDDAVFGRGRVNAGAALWKASLTNLVPPGGGSGLQGEYFGDRNLTILKVTRSDPVVNFDWSYGSPDLSIDSDCFSVRWTGHVEPRASEIYTFYTVSDDGVRLWVNGRLLIDNWTMHAATENSAVISLTAGRLYEIQMDFFENAGSARAQLLWSSWSQGKETIPQCQLYPAAAPSGTGLLARYYEGQDFSTLKQTQTDGTVNFDWGWSAPGSFIAGDPFSARWSGQVQPRFTERYTFVTQTDDGVRLWVNGQLIIEDWTLHGVTENRGTITLTADQKYDIRMEFFDAGGPSAARLLWTSPSQPLEVIPQSCLFPVEPHENAGGGSGGSGGGACGLTGMETLGFLVLLWFARRLRAKSAALSSRFLR